MPLGVPKGPLDEHHCHSDGQGKTAIIGDVTAPREMEYEILDLAGDSHGSAEPKVSTLGRSTIL